MKPSSSSITTSTTENSTKSKQKTLMEDKFFPKPTSKSFRISPSITAPLLITIMTMMIGHLEYVLVLKTGLIMNGFLLMQSIAGISVQNPMEKMVEDALLSLNQVENYGRIVPYGPIKQYLLKEITSPFQLNGNSSWTLIHPNLIN